MEIRPVPSRASPPSEGRDSASPALQWGSTMRKDAHLYRCFPVANGGVRTVAAAFSASDRSIRTLYRVAIVRGGRCAANEPDRGKRIHVSGTLEVTEWRRGQVARQGWLPGTARRFT